jgi:N utilization substance protein A
LLGWKIDIKSEEEKRQEVESQMAALVAPGAPVSVLIDYGLSEGVVEKLVEGGIGTIEKLGSMTPEQLDELGIGEDGVRQIQDSVNTYYGQFEEQPGPEDPGQSLEEAESHGALASEPAVEPAAEEEAAAPEEPSVDADTTEQSGTIEDAGSPHNQSEGAGSREHPEE